MSLHQAAKHLASKGRNGDTTLVHMTKGEVAGLQALAKRHGTSLTTNPDTGLPEAFSLKSLVPMAAGAALTPFVGPMGAAAIVGGLGYMQSGSLTQGLMAGLGAYGGAGLMGGVQAAGAQEVAGQKLAEEAAAQQAEQVLAEQAAVNAQQAAAVGAPGVYTAPGAVPYDAATAADMSFVNSSNALPASTYGVTATPAQLEAARASTSAYDLAGKGITSLGTETGRNAAIQGMGGGMGAAKYGMAAASPIIADKMTPEAYVPPEIKSDADMGQRYKFESGYDNDIPGRTAPASYTQISDEEAKKLYGYAEGGDIQYPTGESVIRMADGGYTGYEAGGPSGGYTGYEAGGPSGDYSGYGISGLSGNYSGYGTPVVAGVAAVPVARVIVAKPASKASAPANGMVFDPVSKTYIGAGPSGNTIYQGGGQYGLDEAGRKAAEEAAAAEAAAVVPDYANVGYGYGGAAQGGLMPDNLHYAAGGGISGLMNYAGGGSTLGSYSDGGRMLKGPGDGMSDSIPANIGGKRPARLADGEFVVPADVVSHLGNGSTDAGAKQLYHMMDKVRQARTGRKAQGREINARKYVPA